MGFFKRGWQSFKDFWFGVPTLKFNPPYPVRTYTQDPYVVWKLASKFGLSEFDEDMLALAELYSEPANLWTDLQAGKEFSAGEDRYADLRVQVSKLRKDDFRFLPCNPYTADLLQEADAKGIFKRKHRVQRKRVHQRPSSNRAKRRQTRDSRIIRQRTSSVKDKRTTR